MLLSNNGTGNNYRLYSFPRDCTVFTKIDFKRSRSAIGGI